jgi:hypothetical protein
VKTMTAVVQSAAGRWRSVHPNEVARYFSSLRAPWWVAGGWALDLFVGDQSRPHKDLDIGVLRRDARMVLSALSTWEIFEAKDGLLTRMREGCAPRANVNSLWCRPADDTDWTFELMLDESEHDRWVFRREPTIWRPLSLAVRRDSGGIPFLAPEIQLLYKSRPVRAEDQADFDHVAPRLDDDARTWLRTALTIIDPRHPWLISSPQLGGVS